MSYKVVRVRQFYPVFLQDYYHRFPEVKNYCYKEQYDHIMSMGFESADYYTKHLRSMGIEAYEIVMNAKPLQLAWAKENGLLAVDERQILFSQLKDLNPNVVILTGDFYGANWIKQLREQISSIKKILVWHCTKISSYQINDLKSYDSVITCNIGIQNFLLNHGIKSIIINHGFEASLLPRITSATNALQEDLIFVGSVTLGEGFHHFRLKFLEKMILDNLPINIYGFLSSRNNILKKQIAYIASNILKFSSGDVLVKNIPMINKAADYKKMPHRTYSKQFLKRVHPPIFGIEMLRALHRSKIAINMHAEVAGSFAGNIRLFEATGAGTCLITDNKKNISDFFIPDEEIVVYDSIDEAIEKIKWLLDNPSYIDEIATKGQQRTLRDHTFQKRAAYLKNIIDGMLGD